MFDKTEKKTGFVLKYKKIYNTQNKLIRLVDNKIYCG